MEPASLGDGAGPRLSASWRADMATPQLRSNGRAVPALLVAAGLAGFGAFVFASERIERTSGLGSALAAGACLLGAGAILATAQLPGAWRSLRPFAYGLLAFALLDGLLLIESAGGLDLPARTYDIVFLAIGTVFVIPAVRRFREHLPKDDRREILADVALVGVAWSRALLVFLQRPSMSWAVVASMALSVLVVTIAIASFGTVARSSPLSRSPRRAARSPSSRARRSEAGWSPSWGPR